MVNSLALYWNLTPTLQRTGSHCSGWVFFFFFLGITDISSHGFPSGAAETRLCVNATNRIYSVLKDSKILPALSRRTQLAVHQDTG